MNRRQKKVLEKEGNFTARYTLHMCVVHNGNVVFCIIASKRSTEQNGVKNQTRNDIDELPSVYLRFERM